MAWFLIYLEAKHHILITICKCFFQLTKPFSIYCLIWSPTTLWDRWQEKYLTFAQQVTVCKILPPTRPHWILNTHWFLMCTQKVYLTVVFYMQTSLFCLWKWNSPRRMSFLALSTCWTSLHFSKPCSRRTLSLLLWHKREVMDRGGVEGS